MVGEVRVERGLESSDPARQSAHIAPTGGDASDRGQGCEGCASEMSFCAVPRLCGIIGTLASGGEI